MKKPGADRTAAILAQLIREADMDGLVTVCQREVADALGVHQTDVSRALQVLSAEGKLVVLRRGSAAGKGVTLAQRVIPAQIQLSESVIA